MLHETTQIEFSQWLRNQSDQLILMLINEQANVLEMFRTIVVPTSVMHTIKQEARRQRQEYGIEDVHKIEAIADKYRRYLSPKEMLVAIKQAGPNWYGNGKNVTLDAAY